MTQPPHLVTVIPMNFTDDRYTDDCHYRGGAWRCYYDIGAYGSRMIAMNALPPYPEFSGERWAEIWEEHLKSNRPYLLTWMDNQVDGPYWKAGSVRGRYDTIKCSLLMFGGWRDGYCNVPLRMSENIDAPHKVLMGPWTHAGPESLKPGPALDYRWEIVRWCNYWLKDEDNGVMDEPRINVYMQSFDVPYANRPRTTGYWRAEPSFPVPGGQDATFALADGGRLSEGTAGASNDYDEYRPTVGVAGGLYSAQGNFGLPTDQRVDEVYSLNYTSDPLDSPFEFIGSGTAKLRVSSTAPVMAFVVKLSDVAPDHTSALVTSGLLNGTRRNSLTDPEPMEPGQVYDLDVPLDYSTWRFEKGHRMRLSVSSADFPNMWPTPYNGANRVYRGSVLELPAVPVREALDGDMPADEVAFEPAKQPSGHYQAAPDEVPWEIVHDILGDRTGMRMRVRNTSRPSPDTQVGLRQDLQIWANNRDPADVSAVGKHFYKVTRSDGVIDVRAVSNVRSTVESLHATIDLDVLINGLPHFQRRWVQTFPRVLL